MPWQRIRISRFGGPEVLQMTEEPTIPDSSRGEIRIKVLAAGAGFPGWTYFAGSFICAALWPVLSFLLLLPQRQPEKTDQNR